LQLAARIGLGFLNDRASWDHDIRTPTVIVDRSSGTVHAGVDKAGINQIFYEARGRQLTVASTLQSLSNIAPATRSIDPQGLFNYIYFHSIPAPGTIFKGINKLDAGERLAWSSGEILRERRLIETPGERVETSLSDLSAQLRHELESAVSRAQETASRPGAFLSGGLDSSTVAGYLAKAHPQAPTFSIGFDAAGYDEIEFARIASNHFGTNAHEYYVTPDDVCDAVEDVVGSFGEPFGNSSAIPVYFCARLAKEHGVDLMLAGDGGDELFAGNFRYKKQMLFEHYCSLPRFLRRSFIEPLLLQTGLGRLPLASKGASYVRQALIPLPDRLQSYNFLHRHDPAQVFDERFLGAVKTSEPLDLWRKEWDCYPDADSIDRMLALDWKFTLHDNDLVKVNSMCRLAGVEVAYPMLDEALIRFSTRVPSDLKLKNGELRWFYKQALREFLPAEIINKKKHGFGLPFGIWLRNHAGLRLVSERALQSLAERGVFRGEFLQQTLTLHREDAAGYYGELVWILMALELWLARHAPGTRF